MWKITLRDPVKSLQKFAIAYENAKEGLEEGLIAFLEFQNHTSGNIMQDQDPMMGFDKTLHHGIQCDATAWETVQITGRLFLICYLTQFMPLLE